MKNALEEYYGTDVTQGQLCPPLTELADMGLIEKLALNRQPTESALTEAGHDALVTCLSWVISRFVTTASRVEELHELVDAQSSRCVSIFTC
jgi:DNA-binding PadR family transcriptional regulator